MTKTSFDTFDNPSASDPSYTLVSSHVGYKHNRHQRVFLVAVDDNDYSNHALQWLLEAMVEDGDEIACLRVVEKDSKSPNESATVVQRDYKAEARRLLEHIQATNDRLSKKGINIIVDFANGNVEKTIQNRVSAPSHEDFSLLTS